MASGTRCRMKPSNSLAPRSGERAGRGVGAVLGLARMATPLSPALSPLHGAREFVRQGFGARTSSCARQVFGATLRTLKAAPSNSLAPRSGERAGERGRRSARTCAHGHTPLPCPLPASRGEGVRTPGIWGTREFVRQGFGARGSSCARDLGREGVRTRGRSSEQRSAR